MAIIFVFLLLQWCITYFGQAYKTNAINGQNPTSTFELEKLLISKIQL